VPKVLLPDGSFIVPGLEAGTTGVHLSDGDVDDIVRKLKPHGDDSFTMEGFRRLLATENDDVRARELQDGEVIAELGTLIKSGRLVWETGAPEVVDPNKGGGGPDKPVEPKPPVKPKEEKEEVTVFPQLEAEMKIVLLDRGLDKHQGGSDAKFHAQPTMIQCSIRQSPVKPKFEKGALLKVEGAGAVEAFEDEKLTKKFDIAKPIPNAKLTGSSPLKLFLKGKTQGKFDLKLEVESPSGVFKADKPVVIKMGVVEILMKVHEQDAAKLKDVEVDPDTDPVSKYWDDLKAKDLPDQKELSDEDKIKKGRRLHLQKNGSHGRAKVVIKKLEAAQWPDGTDDYKIVFTPSGYSESNGKANSALAVADKEFEGNVGVTLKVADGKAADKIFWVEGKTASKKLLDLRLDAGVEGDGLTKRNADWARFTVVELTKVKIEYKAPSKKPAAWNEKEGRFYINFDAGLDARKIKLTAHLSQTFKDVPVHFMLAPDKNNLKSANWGVDLPNTWKWKDVDPAVKHKDRTDRKKLLHISAVTDGKGVATAEVWLSRFGGDLFHPAAYIDQDPHLAKYVHDHADLGKKKPVFCEKTITVWRRFWYKVIKVDGFNAPGFAGAAGQYKLVKAEMEESTELKVSRSKVKKFKPQAIYPRYMVKLNGDDSDAIVVSDTNKANFFSDYKDNPEKPIRMPILLCDAQWDEDVASTPKDGQALASDFPISITTDKLVLKPPLQGGALLAAGTWTAAEPDGAGWKNVRHGNLADGDLSVDKGRNNLRKVRVARPASVANVKPDTRIWIKGLSIQGAKGPYLGEYSSATKRILAVYEPADPVDFQNTIAHEIGHAFKQVTKVRPAGIPAHPHQYDKQGSHCRHATDKCVMYESGPIVGSFNRYCDVCHPYVLVQDMHKFA
jgi:hypothetical protein